MQLRICLLIPTYNNASTLANVVKDCLEQTDNPILVVDDGSSPNAQNCLAELMANSRLKLIRLEKNQGKGVALQTGFKWALEKGFTHVLSLDADAQHPVSELVLLIEKAKLKPFDLIIGQRRFEAKTVPDVSKFGRRFSNFWVQYQTDVAIHDSQSGLRLYPLFHLQKMHFFTRRYDFEIEVLIRLLWKNVGVTEVEVDVYYPPEEERVSHFHKLWDNVRISILNTLLVVISLVRSHLSASKLAMSIFVGLFIGLTPFYGFHSLIVVGLCFLLRLNFGVAWLATQISLPPFIPFIVWATLKLGQQWTGASLDPAIFAGLELSQVPWLLKQFLGTYLLGSLSLGILVSLPLASFSYWVARQLQRTQRNWTGKSRGGVFGNWFLSRMLGLLGPRVSYVFLLFIVPYFYFFAPRAKKASMEYFRQRQEKGFWSLRFKVLKHFYRFGQILMDNRFEQLSRRAFRYRSQGFEVLEKAVEEGQGLLMLGAHVGGWDLAIQYLNRLQDRTHIIRSDARQQTSVFEIRALLEAGRPVALMADRPMSKNLALVRFQSGLFPMDTTAFQIAARLEVPLVYWFAFRDEKQGYVFSCSEQKHFSYPASEDKQVVLQKWAQDYADALAKVLDVYPEQWLNFYPAWSSTPDVFKNLKADRPIMQKLTAINNQTQTSGT